MATLPEELEIHLPRAGSVGLAQDEEYVELEEDGRRRRIRFHDYGEIYAIRGLYERLFVERLRCRSPRVVVELLRTTLVRQRQDPEELRVVDLGAGNGMVGEELARIGAGSIVGVDKLEQAKEAAERDRPGLYDAYDVLDLTDLDPARHHDLEQHRFNCLTCVAALGFGDIAPSAFQTACGLVAPEGWIAFSIRDRLIAQDDETGFARLLEDMAADGELITHARMRYPHRLSVSGEWIHYVAVVARRRGSA